LRLKGSEMQTFGIAVVVLVLIGILALPRVAHAPLWKATVTPLASIIGSGFLVLGPILTQAYGSWTPLMMGALCLFAYVIGHAVRFNILALDRGPHTARTQVMETVSSWVLSFAYIISVAYYLNLLGSFAVSLTPFDTDIAARIVTSLVFLVILSVGWTKGFAALERMEQVSVALKLAIIGGLLFGLGWFFIGKIQDDALVLSSARLTGFSGVGLLLGLLVTVQGFETSRYLGHDYDAATRVRSMRMAQWLSTGIYMIYAVLMAYVFLPEQIQTSETAIIDMMGLVAPVLPALLVLAALVAQFSAAVADTSGAGGLIEELSKGRVPVKVGYAVLVGLGLALTWFADIFQIIAWASKAFAAYYSLQALIAFGLAVRDKKPLWTAAFFACVAGLAACAMIFGSVVE
jgi:hypothetical protein